LQGSARLGLKMKYCFVAKEAFFKAQYALTNTSLNFDDVSIALDTDLQTWEVLDVRRVSSGGLRFAGAKGHFSIDNSLLGAVIALTNAVTLPA
jgi:4'-phosphopantetheinyl transferase EntD